MQAVHDGPRWILKLDRGERLPGTLAEWAEREHVEAASVLFGIGMVEETEIGFLKDGKYEAVRYPEPLELLGLAGSIAQEDGRPSVHLHLTGGRSDHRTIGGHLLSTRVAVLAEIGVETFPGRRFRRPLVEALGVRALDLGEGG